MSKLNDSTLKILKKYRLDTDMSVFGNENKLYDVVKVMDDMVGNQVSKWASGDVSTLSSTSVNESYILVTNGKSLNTYSFTYNSVENYQLPVDVYNYDPLSMKLISINYAGSKKQLYGVLYKDDVAYGYLGVDYENCHVGMYFEPSMSNAMNSVPKGTYTFRQVIRFTSIYLTTPQISFSQEWNLYDMFNMTSSDYRSSLVPESQKIIITLPIEIVDKKLDYYGSGGMVRFYPVNKLSSNWYTRTSCITQIKYYEV